MDNQDQRQNHTPGHEGHGAHVCHTCGWPFPNPHPSAKHRRAHKKVCGTIEGYKLVSSGEASHLSVTVNDDDYLSVLETRSNVEMGGGGIGGRSNRSEDEIFDDAPIDFPDSGSSSGIEDLEDVKVVAANVDLSADAVAKIPQLKEDTAPNTNVPPSSKLVDDNQMQNTEACDPSRSIEEFQEHVLDASIDQRRECSNDYRSPEPADELTSDKGGSSCVPIFDMPDTLYDASPESTKNDAAKELTDHDTVQENMKDNAAELPVNDGTEKQETIYGKDEVGVSVLSSKSTETSNVGVSEDVLPDSAPASGLAPLKEENDEIKVDTSQEKDFASLDILAGMSSGTRETNYNVHMVSVSTDTSVVDNAEIMIKGFKDHVGGNLPLSVTADSLELIDNAKDSDPENNLLSFANESTEVSDLSKTGDTGVPHLNVSCIEQQRSGTGASVDTVANEIEESHVAETSEEQLLSPSCKEHPMTLNTMVAPIEVGVGKSELVSIDDAGNLEATSEVCDVAQNTENKDAVAENSKAIITPSSELEVNERGSLLVGESVNREDSAASGSVEANLSVREQATPESAIDLHDCHVSNNVVDMSKENLSKPECQHLNRVSDDQDRVREESNGIEVGTITVSETAQYNEASKKSLEDHAVVEEPPSDAVNKVSNDQESMMEAETSVIGVGTIADSGTAQGDEELKKTSEDNEVKKLVVSPSDAPLSLKTSAAGDNHAQDTLEGACDNGSASEPHFSDGSYAAQQPDASVADCFVDTISQTDSLEGHWGSVSVLSTQSDIPAVVDAEPPNGKGALAEVDKASRKNQKAASEGQSSEKSDLFEPPSFMTLVEPREQAGSNPKALDSELNASHNPQQPEESVLQAGWFPTLTNVTNDSQGRKKNEEIIAKVTNWSTGKQQHAPLKSLLDKATVESKSRKKLTEMVQKGENLSNKNGTPVLTVSSILGTEDPATEPGKKDVGTEWNSLARYPAEVKRERRKMRERPIWAPFVCCLSPN